MELRKLAVVEETVRDPMFITLAQGAARGAFYGFDPSKKPYMTVVYGNSHSRIAADLRSPNTLLAQAARLYSKPFTDELLIWEPLENPSGMDAVYIPKFFFEGMRPNATDIKVWEHSFFSIRLDAADELAAVLCDADVGATRYYTLSGAPGPCLWLRAIDENIEIPEELKNPVNSLLEPVDIEKELDKLREFREEHAIKRASLAYAMVAVGRSLARSFFGFW